MVSKEKCSSPIGGVDIKAKIYKDLNIMTIDMLGLQLWLVLAVLKAFSIY
jgi:hypothetical protein